MFIHAGMILVVMAVVFAVARWLKLTIELSMFAAAIAGALAHGAGIPVRHIVDGAFTYYDVCLIFITATFFMNLLKEAGGVTYIIRSIITTGTSMKGMGAAGVDIDYEVARIEAVIEEAKKQGILIIGAHIEGMARRVDATDAASIATVIPESKLLLIREDSNEDGYFTKAAEEQGIPIITFKETLDLTDIFKQLFNPEG